MPSSPVRPKSNTQWLFGPDIINLDKIRAAHKMQTISARLNPVQSGYARAGVGYARQLCLSCSCPPHFPFSLELMAFLVGILYIAIYISDSRADKHTINYFRKPKRLTSSRPQLSRLSMFLILIFLCV